MKPTPQISHNQRGSGRDNGTRRSNRRLLLTDYNYHPTPETQMGSSAGQPVTKLPPFHKLSSALLGVVRSRDYVDELMLFVLITGVQTWAVVSLLIALHG